MKGFNWTTITLFVVSGLITLGLFAVSGQDVHGEDENFGQQITQSQGEWVEDFQTPIFDNQLLGLFPQKYEDVLVNRQANNPKVLGLEFANDGKWIEIDLTQQKLYAWEQGQKVFELDVSSGRAGRGTPTGEFTVWRKVKYQVYKGGSKERGDYYYLPNVPYSLFFYNEKVAKMKGYAVHGAYWHNDFGKKRRSNGCVNLRPAEAEKLYYWAGPVIPEGVGAINSTSENPGIKIVIHN